MASIRMIINIAESTLRVLLFILNINASVFLGTLLWRLLYMHFPILTSLLILIIIMHFKISRSGREMEHQLDDFWEKENRANSIRKRPLDDLVYVTVPAHFFEFPYDPADDRVSEALRILNSLKDVPAVNLTGISNTDLKLKYGTANISKLTEYDQNYTMLVRSLQTCANSLHKNGRDDEAKEILEYAIDTGSDISASYDLLSDIYVSSGHTELLPGLIKKAEGLNSLMKDPILRLLSDKNISS